MSAQYANNGCPIITRKSIDGDVVELERYLTSCPKEFDRVFDGIEIILEVPDVR
jgi:hypothetical protein